MRQLVLRPHCTLKELQYGGDNHPDALHLGAFNHEQLIGICSIFPYPPKHLPENTGEIWFRIRGMAVLPEYQGKGVGQKLLKSGFKKLKRKSEQITGIWCNARVTATGLYKKFGMTTSGEQFEIPGTGPHYYMERRFSEEFVSEGQNALG